jgi:hypothetical protein
MIYTCGVDLCALLAGTRRIAVLGMKTEAQEDQPAFYVPRYLVDVGFEVVPVLVYYPNVSTVLGLPVYRSLAAIPGPVDMVVVFRRPVDVPAHEADILAKRPVTVWMQSGIREEDVASRLRAEGMQVVQDRCILVEHRRCAGR